MKPARPCQAAPVQSRSALWRAQASSAATHTRESFETGSLVGDSSTVELRTLTPSILVRIQVPQPSPRRRTGAGYVRRSGRVQSSRAASHGLIRMMMHVLGVMHDHLMMNHQRVTVAVMSRHHHVVRLRDDRRKTYCRNQQRCHPYLLHLKPLCKTNR